MKSNWNVTKLIAAGSLAVLELVLELGGAGIQAVTGIPLGGGVYLTITAVVVVVICLLVIDEFGAATLMRFVLGVLSIPLPSTGTPGFIPKVGIFLVAGILADILYRVLRRNRLLACLVIGAIDPIYYLFAIIWVGRLFQMPGVEVSASIFMSPLMVAGAAVLGLISAYIGWVVYGRIKATTVVARIHGGERPPTSRVS